MARNYKQEGAVLDYTNAGSAIAAGAVVPIGALVGIALTAIPSNGEGAVAIEGVFEVPKASGAAWTVGQKLNLKSGAFGAGAAAAAGDVTGCAVAVAAAGSSATTGLVRLSPGAGTAYSG